MTDYTDSKEQERLQSYLNIHLKEDKQSLPIDEQIEELHKTDRKKWIQLAINIAAILFFGYSYLYDTTFNQTFFLIIAVVFVLNVGLVFYQKNQIHQLIDYLKWKEKHEN
ncbi:MAG TPA: hypothetical protein VJ964_02035 [Balneolaceae bacterium]|nr:hypothetical protein [Balneolaceae bacterium]